MHYSVITPDYITYRGDEYEPSEYGADWICVEASTKREAKLKAVKEWRKQGTEWMEDCRSDNANPYTGLKVESMLCEHGYCFCDLKECIQENPEYYLLDSCPECDKIWEQTHDELGNPK